VLQRDKQYRIVRSSLLHISEPVLAGGEWSASLSGRFTPGKELHGNYSLEGWVRRTEKRHSYCLYREWKRIPQLQSQ
jgi:hypothetical protein